MFEKLIGIWILYTLGEHYNLKIQECDETQLLFIDLYLWPNIIYLKHAILLGTMKFDEFFYGDVKMTILFFPLIDKFWGYDYKY